jgi:hypothetical protein
MERVEVKRLGKFFRLPLTDQYLLVKSVLLLWGTCLGLWVLPFRTLRHLLSKITPTPSVSVKEGTTSIYFKPSSSGKKPEAKTVTCAATTSGIYDPTPYELRTD